MVKKKKEYPEKNLKEFIFLFIMSKKKKRKENVSK